MTVSLSSGASWFRAGAKGLFVLALAGGACLGGWGLASHRRQDAVLKAQEAAETARQQAEQARQELERFRSPPIVSSPDGVPVP